MADGTRVSGVRVPAVVSWYQSTAEVARCFLCGVECRLARRRADGTATITPWTAITVLVDQPRTVGGQRRTTQWPAVRLAVRLTSAHKDVSRSRHHSDKGGITTTLKIAIKLTIKLKT